MSARIRIHSSRRRASAAGFALIELMVALLIAMFLIGGMMLIFQNVRSTYSAQTALASLQDNERLAMTLITDVVESAGYYPNPASYSAATALPASPSFTTAMTPVVTGGNNTYGDTITVRYAPDSSGDMYNCMGGTNTVAPYDTWENTFSIDSSGNLTCTFWSKSANATKTVTLVSNLTNGQNGEPQGMQITYGLDTQHTDDGSCVDTYKTQAQMTATDWQNVCSVAVQLTFVNPLPPADGSAPTVRFTRVIAVMNAAGANT